MKKKSIALILTIALGVSMLAACGNKPEEKPVATPTSSVTIITQAPAATNTPTAAPVETQAPTPEATATTAPVETPTSAPEATPTTAPEATTAPVATATTAPVATATTAPVATATSAPTSTPKPTATSTPSPTPMNSKDLSDNGDIAIVVTPTPIPVYDAEAYFQIVWSNINSATKFTGGYPEYYAASSPVGMNLSDSNETKYFTETIGLSDKIINAASSVSTLYDASSVTKLSAACIRPTSKSNISTLCTTIKSELAKASFKNGKPASYCIMYNNSFIFVILGANANINEIITAMGDFNASGANPDGAFNTFASGNL